jgi:hypothetical protein
LSKVAEVLSLLAVRMLEMGVVMAGPAVQVDLLAAVAVAVPVGIVAQGVVVALHRELLLVETALVAEAEAVVVEAPLTLAGQVAV